MSFEERVRRPVARAMPAVARRAMELERLVVTEGGMLWNADACGDVRMPGLPGGEPDLELDTLAHCRLGPADDAGLWRDGLRYLSGCVLTVAGDALPPPAAAETAGYEVTLAFPEPSVRRRELSLFRTVLVDGEALHQWITLESQSLRAAPVTVALTLAADCRSEPAGDAAAAVSRYERPQLDGATLRFGGARPDGAVERTVVTFDREPFDVRWLECADVPGGAPVVVVTFRLHPALAEPATLAFTISPRHEAEDGAEDGARVRVAPVGTYHAVAMAMRERHARRRLGGAIVSAHQPVLDAVLQRSAADLGLLLTPTGIGGGMAPIAAVPSRAAIRGRDALLAATHTLALDPRIALDTLRLLARHQGRGGGDESGYGDGQIPHVLGRGSRQKGAADDGGAAWAGLEVTPLWLALLAETVEWTGDLDLLDELLPTAWRALGWIDRAAGHAGYLAFVEAGGAHAQDVVTPLGPQAYWYRALRVFARVLRRRDAADDRAHVAALELAAEHLRQRIERDFWLAHEGCYAAGLDAAGRPLRMVTSAAALALWAGVPSGPRVTRLAHRLIAPDLESGWGLRTRSSEDARYDALDPERGAVWPHETMLAAAGLWRGGQVDAGARLARGVFAAAAAQLDDRLPNYYAGDARVGAHGEGPRHCVGAGMPAAIAAAAPFGAIQAMLGCEPDALARRLVLRPALPQWLRRLSVRHLRLGTAYVDLELVRTSHDGGCEVSARVTSGEAQVVVQPRLRARS